MFGFKKGASAKDDKKPAPRGTAEAPKTPEKPKNPIADYATGGATRRRMEALGLKDGGPVRGPGTGTSDDIEAVVPEGSYIMPADSTEQIGEQNLAGLGEPVDVRLSNGEYQLPPEQVHAVGVQTLDAMKNATHVPAAQQQGVKGFQPRGNEQGKPELFFADGGAVQEFSDSVGGYWSSDNAQFEAGSPSTMKRVGRALNPVTSLGSAIGAMRDAAGQGDVAGMGLAAAQAIPVFGAVRAVAPTLKTAAGFVPSAGKTASATAGSAAFGAAADQYTPSEQSFADGGEVEDPRRKRYAERVARYEAGQTPANTPDPSLPNYANRATPATSAPAPSEPSALGAGFKVLAGGGALPFATGIDAMRRGAASLVGGDPNTLEGGASKYADAASGVLAKGTNEAGQIVEGFKAGARDALGVQKAQAAPSVAAPTPAAASPATPSVMPAAQAATQPPSTPTAAPAAAPANAAAMPGGDLPSEPRANDITRVGNSFSGTNIGPGFTVNGQAFQPTGVQRSAQNEQAVQNLMARTPELGSGTPPAAAGFNPGGSRVSVIGDSGRMEDQQRRAFAAASTAHRGAQNGQLTAAQINAMRGLISDERSDRTSRANTEANNATSLQREAMSQAGASSRAAFQEGSQNARFSASNQLDQRRLAGEEEARGFTARQAQRIEKLYDQYDQAKPEDRSAIAQQIRELSGGQQQNRFTVVPGGQEIDPTTQQLVTRPAMVLNNQTGEFVQQQGATGPQAPRPGETRGGYRFKGGNPADQNNWEKI